LDSAKIMDIENVNINVSLPVFLGIVKMTW